MEERFGTLTHGIRYESLVPELEFIDLRGWVFHFVPPCSYNIIRMLRLPDEDE